VSDGGWKSKEEQEGCCGVASCPNRNFRVRREQIKIHYFALRYTDLVMPLWQPSRASQSNGKGFDLCLCLLSRRASPPRTQKHGEGHIMPACTSYCQPRRINPVPSVQYLLPDTVRVSGRRSILLRRLQLLTYLVRFSDCSPGLRTRSVTGHSRGKTKFDARSIIKTLPSELLRSDYSTLLFSTTSLIAPCSVFVVKIVVFSDRVQINISLSW
jgi:hypothetical protein